MTCSLCSRDAPPYVPDETGTLWICQECRARPNAFADGTNPGKETLADVAAQNDAARELAVATARAEAAVEIVRCLVQAFERELMGGYTSPEQQMALRRAKQMVREGK